MKSFVKKIVVIFCVGLLFIVAGCQKSDDNKELQNTNKVKANTNSNPEQIANLANPASVNCINKGGKLEMRNNKNGQYGVCLFEDNRQCEEWALLRGNCPEGGLKITGYENDAQIYCAITGGQVEGVGAATPMCKRIDGTLCNAQANFDGDCPDPNDPNPNAGNVEAP
jgi:putative hemolysin